LSVAYHLLHAAVVWYADVYRPCAEHVLGLCRRYENNDIFPKMRCSERPQVSRCDRRQ